MCRRELWGCQPAGVLEIVVLPLVTYAGKGRIAWPDPIPPQACLDSLHLQNMQWLAAWRKACTGNSADRLSTSACITQHTALHETGNVASQKHLICTQPAQSHLRSFAQFLCPAVYSKG